MKKICALLLSCILSLAFCGCQKEETVSIDGYEWILTTAQNDKGEIVAVMPETDTIVYDENAVTIDMNCIAADGRMTLKDKTNGNAYEGTYAVADDTAGSVTYTIALGNKEGMAVAAFTEYDGGSRTRTLILSIEGYALHFQAGEK